MIGPLPDGPPIDPARVRERLRIIYADLDAAVAEAGPACAASGRCCRFEEYGHTLFVAAAEFALLLADAPPPSRPLDDGATCPWQDDRGRCTAREARPTGCRVYFCDPAYQDRAPVLAERAIADLKRLADELGLPWDYAPLHRHLRRAVEDGRFVNAARAGPDGRQRPVATASGLTLVQAPTNVEPASPEPGPDPPPRSPPS